MLLSWIILLWVICGFYRILIDGVRFIFWHHRPPMGRRHHRPPMGRWHHHAPMGGMRHVRTVGFGGGFGGSGHTMGGGAGRGRR